MKILAWNCQGLTSARAVRALLDLQRCVQPDVFFLSETHLQKAKAEKLRRKLGCDHLIIFESDGRSGGLLMMWKKEVRIIEQGVTENYIDVLIQDENEWRLTGVYGEPIWEQKDKTWMTM